MPTETTPETSPPAGSAPPQSSEAGVTPGETRRVERPLLAEAVDEMTRWPAQDRAGVFRHWHRGALSLVHLNVLAVLEAEGPLPMNRLAEALDVSDASATGIVDRLERRGFLERRHATDDRRVVLVHLTDSGAGVFEEMGAGRRERLTLILGELTDDEVAGLLKGVRALHAARERLSLPSKAAEADACSSAARHGPAATPGNPDTHRQGTQSE